MKVYHIVAQAKYESDHIVQVCLNEAFATARVERLNKAFDLPYAACRAVQKAELGFEVFTVDTFEVQDWDVNTEVA